MGYSPTMTEAWATLVEKVGIRGEVHTVTGPLGQLDELRISFYDLRRQVKRGTIEAPSNWLEAAAAISVRIEPDLRSGASRDSIGMLTFFSKEDRPANRLLSASLGLNDDFTIDEEELR